MPGGLCYRHRHLRHRHPPGQTTRVMHGRRPHDSASASMHVVCGGRSTRSIRARGARTAHGRPATSAMLVKREPHSVGQAFTAAPPPHVREVLVASAPIMRRCGTEGWLSRGSMCSPSCLSCVRLLLKALPMQSRHCTCESMDINV